MVEIVTPERKQKLKEAEEKSKSLARQLSTLKDKNSKPFLAWLQKAGESGDRNASATEPEDLIAHLPLDKFENNLTQDRVRAPSGCSLQGRAKPIGQAKFGGGLKIEGNGFVEVKKFGDFEHNQSFSYGAWVKVTKDNLTGAIFGKMDEGNKHRGYDLWLQGGRPGRTS